MVVSCYEHYSEEDNLCVADTQPFMCAPHPEHAVRNTVSGYIQTRDGSAWMPAESLTTFNEIGSTQECRFVCATDYKGYYEECVDSTAPTCEVSYSPDSQTNTDVVATLVNCSKPITGDQTYTFTGNGTHTFTFIDQYENTGSTTAIVTWIDKTPVIPVVSYDPDSYASGDITVTVTLNTTGSETIIPE